MLRWDGEGGEDEGGKGEKKKKGEESWRMRILVELNEVISQDTSNIFIGYVKIRDKRSWEFHKSLAGQEWYRIGCQTQRNRLPCQMREWSEMKSTGKLRQFNRSNIIHNFDASRTLVVVSFMNHGSSVLAVVLCTNICSVTASVASPVIRSGHLQYPASTPGTPLPPTGPG